MTGHLQASIDLHLGEFELRLDGAFDLSGVLGVLGPSGSGKTSMLRVLAGLERGAQGRVVFDQQTWQDTDERVFLAPHQRQIGYVFQDARLLPHLTVAGNLEFAAKRATGAVAVSDRDAIIDILDLSKLLQRKPERLSGGEQQRVAVARALMTNPRMLLMDEPLAATDLERRAELLPFFRSVIERFNIPTVYVSHSLNELATLAKTLLVIRQGRLAALGPTRDIMQRLDLGEVSGAEEAGAVITAEIVGHDSELHITQLRFGEHLLTVPRIDGHHGKPIALRIHARDVALATEEPRGLSIRNVLPGRVMAIREEVAGPAADIVVSIGDQVIRARITRASARALALAVETPVYVLIKAASVETD